MEVIEAIYQRRSVRAFTTEMVSAGLVDELISAAAQAPSAMNLQPWAFVIIEGRAALRPYSERAKRHLLDTMLPGSPLFHYRDQLFDPMFDIFYGAPLLVVIAATDEGAQSAEDCCLAAQNLMLMAGTMGLGTCCIGFARPWLNLAKTKSELGIPPYYTPVVPIAVGHPRSAAPPVPRRRPEVYWARQDAGASASSPGEGGPRQTSGRTESGCTQPKREFNEPAAAADRENLGTNVAPSRVDMTVDPRADTRTRTLESCSLPDEDEPNAADF